MKKKKLKPRNVFAFFASKRKAGSHRKTNKAIRRKEKVRVHDETGYHS